jgi:hypothetical protein
MQAVYQESLRGVWKVKESFVQYGIAEPSAVALDAGFNWIETNDIFERQLMSVLVKMPGLSRVEFELSLRRYRSVR